MCLGARSHLRHAEHLACNSLISAPPLAARRSAVSVSSRQPFQAASQIAADKSKFFKPMTASPLALMANIGTPTAQVVKSVRRRIRRRTRRAALNRPCAYARLVALASMSGAGVCITAANKRCNRLRRLGFASASQTMSATSNRSAITGRPGAGRGFGGDVIPAISAQIPNASLNGHGERPIYSVPHRGHSVHNHPDSNSLICYPPHAVPAPPERRMARDAGRPAGVPLASCGSGV